MGLPSSTQLDADALKQRVDLRDIIAEELGPGKRSGRSLRWADGGHNKTVLSATADFYSNFKTGEKGDVFGWFVNRHGMTRRDAITYVYERVTGTAAPLPTRTAPVAAQTAHNEPPSAAWQSAARQALAKAQRLIQQPSAAHARRYLNGRGITDEMIVAFGLGYNPDWMRTAYNDPETGQPAWLPPGIVIPWIVDGVVWALRVRTSSKTLGRNGKPLPKYMNMTGSKAAGALYNADALQPDRDALIVEGEFDCMLAQRLLGDRVAVVTLGSASNTLERRWADQLRTAGTLYALLDNDDAGQAATERLRETLGEGLRVLHLPSGKDVTDYYQGGGDVADWFEVACTKSAIYVHDNDSLPYELPGAFTLWEAARLAIVCPAYVLIQMHTLAAGIGQGFTAAQLAECMDVSKDKAQKLINSALEWQLVSLCDADLQGKEGEDYLLFKSAARCYRLTPALGLPLVSDALPKHVLELTEAPNPERVLRSVAKETGLDDITAAQVETVTSAVSLTIEADRVVTKVEKWAWEKAQEIEDLAASNTTPFAPDVLPVSVRELRTALIETYQATNPDKTWLHSEFMWVAGVKKGSVSALIAKSDKIAPALKPTFKNIQIDGRVTVGAAGKLARREHGAPVAWINAAGEVVGRFSAHPPADATGIKLNCGKTYGSKQAQQTPLPEPPQAEQAEPPPKPIDRDELVRRRARAAVLPHLRGCLVARGWKHFPGPYGCWERDGQEYPDAWEGIIEALLEDYLWAVDQQQGVAA